MKKKLILLALFLAVIIVIPFLSYIISPPKSTDATVEAAVAKISGVSAETTSGVQSLEPTADKKATSQTVTSAQGELQTMDHQNSMVPQTVETESSQLETDPNETNTTNADTTFRLYDDSSETILTVKNRDFLIGTLACELSPTSPIEALKAQAVAAYTYYSKLRQEQQETPNEEHHGADFSVNTKAWLYYTTKEQMQIMWGDHFDQYYQQLEQAVDAIEGQTLQYNGELITASYFAISSGQTENSADIWGGVYPYLTAVASPWDKYADDYKSTKKVSADTFRTMFLEEYKDCKFTNNPEDWIGKIERTDSGSVTSIQIGGETFDGLQVRNLFGLRSSNFTIDYKKNTFTFTVIGYGHGVGMSQNGAVSMADQGSTYDEILSWYYPGTELVG